MSEPQDHDHMGHDHDQAARSPVESGQGLTGEPHESESGHAGGHASHTAHAPAQDDHGTHVDHTGHEAMFRRRFWVSLILSIPVLMYSPTIQAWLGFSAPPIPGSAWITPVFSLIVFAYGGVPFLQMARPEVQNRQPGMMTLISLAISVALVYSLAALVIPTGETFFWELVTLIDVMLLGHWIEMRSVRQASGALQELARLMPDTAERIDEDGETREVPVARLRRGDLVLVRPGASIPADGEVEEGESDVNEAMVTGESKPVSKSPGDQVIAGTINGDGSLRVRVTATGDETALAGIMRLVEQAQQSKSRTQILGDRAAGWLFYIAIGVAVVTGVVWLLAVGFQVDVIARVATVLVIACPHALGLAIPLVVAITTAIGASNGILVRDRLALEQAREIDTVIFDKTGTLTEGQFGVVGVQTVDGWDENKALTLTAAVEGDSEHTIARGIRRAAEERGLPLPTASGFEAIKGRGVRAHSDGRELHVGGPRLLEMLEADPPDTLARFAEEASAKGRSVVYLIEHHMPVAVTFCQLCNSTLVFDRRLPDGTVLDFGTTGNVRFSDLVMYDRQTESWWQQLTGEAIVGDLLGTRLEILPSQIIAWSDFRDSFPDAKVLSRETGYVRDYGRNPYVGYDSASQPFLFADQPDDRLPAMERVVTVLMEDEAAAYPFAGLSEVEVVNDELGGVPIVIFWKAGTASSLDASSFTDSKDVGSTGVFRRELEGQVLTFEATGGGRFRDQETGTTWDIFGEALEGPLAGAELTPMVSGEYFWFSWAAFKPDTRVWSPGD